MLKLKFPARRELQDSSLPIWQRYADWLLGEDVFATHFKSVNSDFIHRPAWKQLLATSFKSGRTSPSGSMRGPLSLTLFFGLLRIRQSSSSTSRRLP
eukprot:1243690-Amphidinium_carterae.1